jgi:tetratricopeptide (TPR) repeat protein
MSCPKAFPVSLALAASFLFLFTNLCAVSSAQISRGEQVQITPPLIRMIDPPAPDATPYALEARGDQLRSSKLFLDALDYYHAALAKTPAPSRVMNKIGITELMMQRFKEAKKSFEQSIKTERGFADAYNNLGVVYYEEKKYGAAVKEYHKAINIDGNSASFFSNLGAALFSKKEFDPAVIAYEHALAIDPEVFERTSRGGVQAQLPSPGDRAHYDYTVARLYARMGLSDRSLEYLKKAMEEGYKELQNVYKDEDFTALRKDPRFTELMNAKTPAISD